MMQHQFFENVDWNAMMKRQCQTPYKPQIKEPTDTSHFDQEQTSRPVISPNSSPPSALGSKLSQQSPLKSSQLTDKSMLYEVESYEDEFDDFYFSQSSTAFGMGAQQSDELFDRKVRRGSFELTNDDELMNNCPKKVESGIGSKSPNEKLSHKQL